jgi:hypothetical protein
MGFLPPLQGEGWGGDGSKASKPIPILSGGLALHSQPAPAAQSGALRNPAFAPLKGKEPAKRVWLESTNA